jgi:putative ABC transport system substrate-binding protein
MLFAAPLTLEAQHAAPRYRIGVLSPTALPPAFNVFRNRLTDLGYVEGRTIQFESRNAEGHPERLPALAADLVRLKVDVLVTLGTQATNAAKQATSTIPIMFLGVASPVEAGIVMSLAQPGGNVTGATDQIVDLGGKVLQLVTEIAPKRSRIGFLGDFTSPGSIRMQKGLDQQAQQIGMALVPINVRTPEDLDAAFATLSRERARALMVASTPALIQTRDRVATFAIQNRLPSIGYTRSMVEAGLLMSYGTSWSELAKRAAEYVDRILKGAHPAELPVVQPTAFEFIINLKTAKTLGLTIPPSLLGRADEVIQ